MCGSKVEVGQHKLEHVTLAHKVSNVQRELTVFKVFNTKRCPTSVALILVSFVIFPSKPPNTASSLSYAAISSTWGRRHWYHSTDACEWWDPSLELLWTLRARDVAPAISHNIGDLACAEKLDCLRLSSYYKLVKLAYGQRFYFFKTANKEVVEVFPVTTCQNKTSLHQFSSQSKNVFQKLR